MGRDINYNINTHFATETMKSLRAQLGEREWAKAVASMLNRVSSMGKVKANRLIRDTYKIAKKDLDRNMGVNKATRRSFTATIFTFGVPLPLGLFRPKQMRGGVSVNIMGKRRTVPHAFIATVKAGKKGATHTGVFARGQYGPNGFVHRKNRERKKGNDLGITQLVTTSQAVMFSNEKVMKETLSVIDKMVPVRLEHEALRLLAGVRQFGR